MVLAVFNPARCCFIAEFYCSPEIRVRSRLNAQSQVTGNSGWGEECTMKRSASVVFTGLLVLAGSVGLAAPAAAAGGNNAASSVCKQGGWQTLTDANGNTFKNQGQCVSYAVQGGTLLPVEENSPSVEIHAGTTAFDGYITGTGFAPEQDLRYLYWPTDADVDQVHIFPDVDAEGSFEYNLGVYWCHPDFRGDGLTTLTLQDSAHSVVYSMTIDLNEYCT